MTVMAEKLKQAGVRVPPLTERVWREVKAHPGRTCAHIAQTLMLTPKQTSILLWNLERRGMVTSLPLGGKHNKQVKTYSTTLVTYELLPILRLAKSTCNVSTAPAPQDSPRPEFKLEPRTQRVSDPEQFVSQLTVADARALFNCLKTIFGS